MRGAVVLLAVGLVLLTSLDIARLSGSFAIIGAWGAAGSIAVALSVRAFILAAKKEPTPEEPPVR